MNKIKKFVKIIKSGFENTCFGVKLTFSSSPVLTFILTVDYVLQRLFPLLYAYALKEIINLMVFIDKYRSFHKLVLWTIAFILCLIFSKFSVHLGHLIYTALEKKTRHNIDNMLIDKIISCDLSFFDNSKDHDILKVVQDNQYIISNITWNSLWIIANIISLVSIIAILISLSPFIAILIAFSVIPTIIVNKRFYDFIWRYDWEKSNEYRKMYYYYNVLCNRDCAEELRLYNNTKYFTNLYFDMWRSWYTDKNIHGIRHNFTLLGTYLIQTAGIAVTFIYAVYKFAANKIGVGDIQYYVNITEQVKKSLTEIFDTTAKMQVDSEKIAVIRDFLKWQPEIKSNGLLIPKSKPKIEFCNVSFKYPNTDKWVLKDCSFKIANCEKVAFVGLNGAGKSTIVKLLLRFYDPDEGDILFDGISVKEYDINALRRIFGAQFQDFATYSMSIKMNIMLGDIRNQDETRVYKALEFSHADKFVLHYENGMETQISRLFDEKGIELSGGQKQKLALSRAFYRNADIIILDEPSASLDPEAEHEIFKKFIELWKNHGAILISHRLANVTLCDKIFVIDSTDLDGGCKVTEQGSHEELLRQNGKYAHLFNLQAGKYL